MKRIKQLSGCLLCAFFFLFAAADALAQEDERRFIGHVIYGLLMIENDDPDLQGGDYEIGMFGADAQRAFGGHLFRYGVEAGALFAIDSEVRDFAVASGAGGGAVAVSMNISSFLVDYYFGGFVSFEPASWLRIYTGAGPLVIWGYRDTEPEESEEGQASSESESGLGVGVYGRAGLDLLFTKNLGIGAGVRIIDTSLSFEEGAGKFDVAGWQYYFGLTFRF